MTTEKFPPQTHHSQALGTVVIRIPSSSEAGQLGQLLDEILEDGDGMVASPGEIETSAEKQAERLQKFVRTKNWLLLGLFSGEELIASLDFQTYTRAALSHGGWFGLAVRKNRQGCGAGRLLMNALLEWLPSTSVERLDLRVRSDNARAIRLYKSLGFVEEGRFHKSVKLRDGRYFDDVAMVKFLG